MSSDSRARRLARRLLAAAFALAAFAPLACSSDEGCPGVVVAGQCQATCDASKCAGAPTAVCFDNACAQACDFAQNNSDCPLGTRCESIQFADGTIAQHCVLYDFAKGGSGKTGQNEPCADNAQCDVKRGWQCLNGVCSKPCTDNAECNVLAGEVCEAGNCIPGGDGKYIPCTSSSECAQGAGFLCVDGECRITGCSTHDDCAVLGLCETGTTDTNQKVLACKKGTTYPPGQFGTKCPGGAAAMECDDANGYVCIGAGPGDIDAYCTKTGCQTDTDCATGYACSTVRTSRPPCADACGFTGQPANANCVPAGNIGAGQEYSCGPISLLRNLCLKREFCNECETDADCLGKPGQFCSADSGGRKICTVVCDPNTNSCPWGNAATCDDWDKDGVFSCSHRFSTGCVGSGKSCEPCLDDGDCPGGICLQSDFTREKYCVDLAVSCDCTGLPTEQNVYCIGGGCPTTPGGLQMRCYGGSQVQSTSPVYHKCLGANVNPNPLSSPQTGCWPAL